MRHGTIVGQPAEIMIREAINNAFETQIRVEAASGVEDDFTFEVVQDRKLFEQTISNYVEVTTNHLVKLKKRLNNLVTINRLPVELFTYIILLVDDPEGWLAHPYISYSWVCSHWRSALIKNPTFWTFIRLESREAYNIIHPFVDELLRRYHPLRLDLVVYSISNSTQFSSTLEDFFAKETDRIGKLWLRVRDIPIIPFASGRFPSLREVSCIDGRHSLYRILPILLASDHLETIQCSLSGETPVFAINQLAPVFCRIRNINLTFYEYTNIGPLLDLLHNSTNLQNLQLALHHTDKINFTKQIVLPELQFLSTDNLCLIENIRAPQLSSLAITGFDPSITETLPLPNFDFPGMKHLYILGYSTLGFQEPIPSAPPLSRNIKDIVESIIIYMRDINLFQDIFSLHNILSEPCPRNCFRFEFCVPTSLIQTLRPVLCPLLSRMENITELYLLSHALLEYFKFEGNLDKILLLTPSVEKLVVPYDNLALTDFILPLGNTSLCPRLNHLSYISYYSNFLSREKAEYHAEKIGRILTECLQSRHEVYGDRLKYIAIEQCPPLPDTWLKELESLGTKVITAKDFERGSASE